MVYRFDQFEVDDREFRLSQDGAPVQVEPKVLRLLVYLIENRNRLVRKQELLDKVWPDAMVTENALTRAIVLLRKALNEDSRVPRYLETIPTAGYRFIANVTTQTGAPSVGSISPEAPTAAPEKHALASPKKWILSTALLLIAAAGGTFLYFHHARKVFTDKDTIMLADFNNSTGDPVFDDTLRQGLSVELEQTPFLQLLSDVQIGTTLRLMEKPSDTRLTPGVAREACRRANATAVIAGSIAALGNQYVIGLNAVDCRSGETLAQEQISVNGKENVLIALGSAASKLRAKLGESRDSLEKFDTPLEQATTSSLEALEPYTLGRRVMDGANAERAPSFFQRAIQLDPNFAMAYARLGTSYGNLGEPQLGIENMRQAYQLRERLSEPEKLYIESHFYQLVTGDLERSRQVLELWAQTYPRDWTPKIILGSVYQGLGQDDKALEEFRETLRLYPTALVYANLVSSYLRLDRLQEARSTADQALENNFDSPRLHQLLYQLAFLQRDPAGMTKEADWAAGQPGAEAMLLSSQADTAAYYGRLGEARNLSRLTMASALNHGAKETAAARQVKDALFEAESGDWARARADAQAAIKLGPNRDVKALGALALAQAAETASTEKLAATLDKDFPAGTLVQRYWLPTIRAEINLQRKDPAAAIKLLQVTSPIELADPSMYPVYVRGEAYLALHDGNRAAVEFQKYIDHRGLARNSPVAMLARLGLARAYAMEGNTPKARAAYQDFLTTWKDADPNIPIFIQAKDEHAKLQ
jgi:DNA-binding winged helix-turn-helix (wHTH) protein/tetratricopeptide (TPR) repeat protein